MKIEFVKFDNCIVFIRHVIAVDEQDGVLTFTMLSGIIIKTRELTLAKFYEVISKQ